MFDFSALTLRQYMIEAFPDGTFVIANYVDQAPALYFAGIYFITTCLMLTLHYWRGQISLGPVLALSGLLTFLVWQLLQIGWWVDWQDFKINAALLGIIPALMIGATLTYAIDGVRAARAYHLILLSSSVFSICYAFFLETLGNFTPTPSLIFAPVITQVARAGSIVLAGLLCSVGYELARRVDRWIALPVGFIFGYASFLPLYSLFTYGLDAGILNMGLEWPEYTLLGAPAAVTLLFYGIMAIRSDLVLPARSALGLFGKKQDTPAHEPILDAREQIAELRQLNQALQQEEALREHQMQKSPLAMLEMDKFGRLRRFNPAAQNLLDSFLAEGQSIYAALPQLQSLLQAPELQRKQILKPILTLEGENGFTRSIELTILPLFADKAVHGYSILAEDVSSREQEVKKRLLSERVREIHKAGQVIHHDFSNLLLGIQGHLTALSGRIAQHGDAEAQNAIDAIAMASKRGKEMLHQLGAGQVFQHPELKPQNLEALLSEALRIITPQAASHQVRLHLSADAEIEVEVDSTQILRVILNLLSNAVRAMPQGGDITIAATRSEQGALIIIRDTGTGMTAEQLNQAFDPGFSTKGQGQGGLGLSISYLITEAHGGRLSLESQPGQGTIAKIWLPISVEKAKIDPGSEGVLLLLSDPQRRQQLAAEFHSMGCEVAELQDCNELRAMLEEDPEGWTVLIRGKTETMPRDLWHECRFLSDVVIDLGGKDPPRIRPSSKSRLDEAAIQRVLKAA